MIGPFRPLPGDSISAEMPKGGVLAEQNAARANDVEGPGTNPNLGRGNGQDEQEGLDRRRGAYRSARESRGRGPATVDP